MWIVPAKSFLFFRKIRTSVFVVGVTKLANYLREICIHQLASRSRVQICFLVAIMALLDNRIEKFSKSFVRLLISCYSLLLV